MEVLLPGDDAAKNGLCVPHHHPDHPSDWFKQMYISFTNQENIFSAIGSEFSTKWRLSLEHHIPPEKREHAKNFKLINRKNLFEKLQSFGNQIDFYDQYKLLQAEQ